jgi:AcrR family transcriptional regulator
VTTAGSAGDRRRNQRLRTRKDLLQAAARLLREGRQPTMAELADEARVSRATAYRYFDCVEAVLAEAPVDTEVPAAETLFRDDASTDPVERLLAAEAALHAVTWRNRPQLRAMLAHTLRQPARADGSVPLRQNRRGPLIDAALAPLRRQLDRPTYERLRAALALVFGTEAMVVFTDVLQMEEAKARKVKEWAVRALVAAAMEQTAGRSRSRR